MRGGDEVLLDQRPARLRRVYGRRHEHCVVGQPAVEGVEIARMHDLVPAADRFRLICHGCRTPSKADEILAGEKLEAGLLCVVGMPDRPTEAEVKFTAFED